MKKVSICNNTAPVMDPAIAKVVTALARKHNFQAVQVDNGGAWQVQHIVQFWPDVKTMNDSSGPKGYPEPSMAVLIFTNGKMVTI